MSKEENKNSEVLTKKERKVLRIKKIILDAAKELFCEKSFDPRSLIFFNNIAKKVTLKVKDKWIDKSDLYIDATVETKTGKGHATIKHTHTNLVLLEANNEILYEIKNL